MYHVVTPETDFKRSRTSSRQVNRSSTAVSSSTGKNINRKCMKRQAFGSSFNESFNSTDSPVTTVTLNNNNDEATACTDHQKDTKGMKDRIIECINFICYNIKYKTSTIIVYEGMYHNTDYCILFETLVTIAVWANRSLFTIQTGHLQHHVPEYYFQSTCPSLSSPLHSPRVSFTCRRTFLFLLLPSLFSDEKIAQPHRCPVDVIRIFYPSLPFFVECVVAASQPMTGIPLVCSYAQTSLILTQRVS